jgi:hypothetical protein
VLFLVQVPGDGGWAGVEAFFAQPQAQFHDPLADMFSGGG